MKTSNNLDIILKALADPNRRKIVDLLREAGKLRVTDLSEAFDMSLNGVSKHIKYLERAGIITRVVQWKEHYLELNQSSFDEAYQWFSFYHQFWNKRLDNLSKIMKERNDK